LEGIYPCDGNRLRHELAPIKHKKIRRAAGIKPRFPAPETPPNRQGKRNAMKTARFSRSVAGIPIMPPIKPIAPFFHTFCYSNLTLINRIWPC